MYKDIVMWKVYIRLTYSNLVINMFRRIKIDDYAEYKK